MAVVGASAAAAVVLGTGASGTTGAGYEVRAIFDNVSGAVEGEDVKVAGAKVGAIKSLDVTPEKKAAVVLRIDEEGFAPFHKDARCTIRPQSLIGEKFVECDPGTGDSPPLDEIEDGEAGAGEHFLPLERTSAPVDLDLINDIMRLPYRTRLALIINEFGTALAGRGADLNEVIHRANPALRETDEVLKILASQNRTLARLAENGDRSLGPLARERAHVSNFIVQANETAQASAERRVQLEQSFQRLPRFLEELKPTMEDLGALSDEMTPVIADLGDAAPDLNRFILALGPFSKQSTPALDSLGDALKVGAPALRKTEPLLEDLTRFGKDANPLSKDLKALTVNFDKTGGIERLMDYIFFQVTAINGFDGVSHYLRAGLMANLCSAYSTAPAGGCNSNFTSQSSGASSQKTGDRLLDKLHAQLADGSSSNGSGAKPVKKDKKSSVDPFATLRALTDPRLNRERQSGIDNTTGGAREPAVGRYAPKAPEDQALDYLLGSGP
jgi:ABC-type transporter Mla subunit MlaD